MPLGRQREALCDDKCVRFRDLRTHPIGPCVAAGARARERALHTPLQPLLANGDSRQRARRQLAQLPQAAIANTGTLQITIPPLVTISARLRS